MSAEQAAADQSRTIVVTARQLWLIRAALEEYLSSFSHTEGDLIDEIKQLLEDLPSSDGPESARLPDGSQLTL
jgi:hypothetical protein